MLRVVSRAPLNTIYQTVNSACRDVLNLALSGITKPNRVRVYASQELFITQLDNASLVHLVALIAQTYLLVKLASPLTTN